MGREGYVSSRLICRTGSGLYDPKYDRVDRKKQGEAEYSKDSQGLGLANQHLWGAQRRMYFECSP